LNTRTSTLRAAIALTVSATLVALECAACLDDLPPPKACPPPAVHEAGDCTPIFNATEPNCLSDHANTAERESCLAGPRSSCACGADECPATGSTCYPDGDCPPEVIDAAGPEARCVRFAPEDFGFGIVTDAGQCMCGCARCASVCDGQGPIIGVLADAMPLYAAPAMNLGGHLPDRGSLGIYVRARGVTNLSLGVFTGDYVNDPAHLEPRSVYFMTTSLDDFTEQVFFGPDFIGNKIPYAWTDEAGKPTTLVLFNQQPAEGAEPILTFYELDCVVPFFVP